MHLTFKVESYYSANSNAGTGEPLDAEIVVLMYTAFTLTCNKLPFIIVSGKVIGLVNFEILEKKVLFIS